MKTPHTNTLQFAALAIGALIVSFAMLPLDGGASIMMLGLAVVGLTLQSEYDQDAECLDYTAVAAMTAGDIIQLADGRAAQVIKDIAAGDTGSVRVCGLLTVAKTASIVILDGGRVFWDHSADAAHFRKVNDRDFCIGTAVGDAASAATTMAINLNVEPRCLIDVARDPVDSVLVLTAGAPQLRRLGGAQSLEFDTTAEAQKVDVLSKDGFAIGANAIVEFAVEVVDNGDAAALDFNIGIANATHASDGDAITEAVFIHIDGASLDILAESDDGTTEVAATDTTVNYAEGTRIEVWIDCRDPADIQLYIDGVNVLPASVFKLDSATGPMKLLAHLEKSADDTPGEVHVEWLRVRIAEQ